MDLLHKIAKKKNHLAKKCEIKVTQNTNLCKIMKFKCHEIYEPQNRQINVLQKFHVIR